MGTRFLLATGIALVGVLIAFWWFFTMQSGLLGLICDITMIIVIWCAIMPGCESNLWIPLLGVVAIATSIILFFYDASKTVDTFSDNGAIVEAALNLIGSHTFDAIQTELDSIIFDCGTENIRQTSRLAHEAWKQTLPAWIGFLLSVFDRVSGNGHAETRCLDSLDALKRASPTAHDSLIGQLR